MKNQLKTPLNTYEKLTFKVIYELTRQYCNGDGVSPASLIHN